MQNPEIWKLDTKVPDNDTCEKILTGKRSLHDKQAKTVYVIKQEICGTNKETMDFNQVPTKIHRPKPYLLTMEWPDGFSATVTLRAFREACPCAVCKGENIMGTTYSFGMMTFKPGMYDLDVISSTGNYGIKVAWKDGHNTGIYTWEILRAIAQKHKLSEEELLQLDQLAEKEQQ